MVRALHSGPSGRIAAGSGRWKVSSGVRHGFSIERSNPPNCARHDPPSSPLGTGSFFMITIRGVRALEILDSRGNPTLQVTVALSDGNIGKAHAPAGASTGRYEAVDLRDGDAKRYRGKGVLRAIENVERVLGQALDGMDAEDQAAADRRLIELDG